MATNGRTATHTALVEFPQEPNEHGGHILWFASWLEGSDGIEGDWFYSGRGGEAVSVAPPPEATGLRIRRWVSDGLTPEYADLALGGDRIDAGAIDFDRRQRFVRITETAAASR